MKSFLPQSSLSTLSTLFRYGKHIRPARDWFVLLTIAGALLLGSIVYNVYLLIQVEKGEIIGEVPVSDSSFNTAPLDAVEAIFTARKEEEVRYKTQYRFVDPATSGS